MIYKTNNRYINPFTIYSATWSVVLLTYSLEWSNLCPPLTLGYKLFLISTILFSLIVGIVTGNKGYFKFRPLKDIKTETCRKFIWILYALFMVEVAVAGNFPILSYLSGNRDVDYSEFALPFIHIIIANGLVLIVLYSYYGLKSTSDKAIRKKCKINIWLSCIPFILMFSRGPLMYCFIGCVFLNLMCNTRVYHLLLKLLLAFAAILFIFGALGNLRTDVSSAKNLILQIGEANDNFYKSHVPDEFFWAYLYIATPLANAQYMVNLNKVDDINFGSLCDFAIFELTPEIISKRLQSDQVKPREMDKILDAFNVSSVYGTTYKYLGWWGPILTYLFWLYFVIVTLGLIPKKSHYYILAIVVVSIITFMNLFDNMLIFMGLVPQALILIVLGNKIKLKLKRHILFISYSQKS